MQLLLPLSGEAALIAEVHGRLLARFGRPGPFRPLDPVSQLVMGIIGGRTLGADSLRAFEALRARFASWEALRDGPAAAVEAAIRPVTYGPAKAQHLQRALHQLTALRERLELDFLGDWPVESALVWLERLPGVGRKVSAATLNFSTLRRPALVIDTHHLRVLARLHLVDPRAAIAEAYDHIVPRLPNGWDADDLDDHHQLLKKLGQTYCHAGTPSCGGCPLRDLCPSGCMAPVVRRPESRGRRGRARR